MNLTGQGTGSAFFFIAVLGYALLLQAAASICKQSFFHCFYIVFISFSYGFHMVFIWFSYGFHMVFTWFSYGFHMVFRLFSYGFCVKFVLYACPIFLKHLPKLFQKSTKMAPKIDQNWYQIGLLGSSWGDHVACFVFCCFFLPLFPPLGGILEPTWHQVGPKLGQVGGKLGQVGAKMRHVGAKLAQVGAKVAQVGAKLARVGQNLAKMVQLEAKDVHKVVQDVQRCSHDPPKIIEKHIKTIDFSRFFVHSTFPINIEFLSVFGANMTIKILQKSMI